MIKIRSIHVGKVQPLGPPGQLSAIAKQAIAGPAMVTKLGLEEDEQADRRHHGGPEMAVHHYPFEHYHAWRRDCPKQVDRFAVAGAFGENLSSLGVTEEAVCIGDIYKVGDLVLQMSQGRQPCWKLNARFNIDKMAALVQQTGRTGWYYRVLEEGMLAVGDTFELLNRPHPNWPLAKVIYHLYIDTLNDEANRELAELIGLSPSWRQLFSRRLETQTVEEWERRLR